MNDILTTFLSSNKYSVNANSQIINNKNKLVKKTQLIGEIIEYLSDNKLDIDTNSILRHIDRFISDSATKANPDKSLTKVNKPSDPNRVDAFVLRQTYFYYAGAQPDCLYWCKKYKDNSYGLDLYLYGEGKYIHRPYILRTLSFYFPEFIRKSPRGEIINLQAIEHIAERREFVHCIWSPKCFEREGKPYANTWHAPTWWRHENNEVFENEELPWVNAELPPIERVIEALLRHTLQNDELQIRIAIKWLSNSCQLSRNRKALCIFGAARTGKSLITEVLLQILHGQNYDSCKVAELFEDGFESGTLQYKTAVSFPEIEVGRYLKPFLDFLSSENFKAKTKFKQRLNLVQKHLNITINANNLVGEEVFKKSEERVLDRVIILSTTNQKLIGATVTMGDGSEFRITKEDILRLVDATHATTAQAAGDQIKVANYIHERSKADRALDLESEAISGYMNIEASHQAIFTGLDYWQEIMLQKFMGALKRKQKNGTYNEPDGGFHTFDALDLQYVMSEMKKNQDCRHSLEQLMNRRELKKVHIVNFFKEANQKFMRIKRHGRTDSTIFLIQKSFCRFLIEDAFEGDAT